jgi:hypothetical protein
MKETSTMTKKDATTAMRQCIGSKTFGIEPHEAPTSDFPVQPSQKDGLGRMCKPHWRAYTNALRKAALARKATEAESAPQTEPEPVAEPEPSAPKRGRRAKAAAEADVPEAAPEPETSAG